VSDTPESAAAFAAANLAIGLSAGRTRAFPAPVDLLAPDLAVVAEAAAAGERRDRAARDTIWLSAAANAVGALWLFARRPTVRAASTGANLARAAALVTAWARLRGGRPHRSSIALLVDPRPERWARVGVARTLRALGSRLTGLTHREAASRLLPPESTRRVPPLVGAMREQLASPLTVFLAAGAVLSLATGAVGDVLLIATVIVANAAIGAFQEARVDRASEELERLTGSTAAVLRGGSRTRVPAAEVVPGDILLLSHGERVAADARLIKARGLEVDESPLTGESLPVRKDPHGPDAARVVLAGSDVAVGHGRAVAVAVGPDTRLGTTAAALGLEREVQGPLGRRLGSMVMQCVPAAGAGALVILLAGLLHRRPLVGQLALAASTAVAAVPEALPLIAGTGQAAVAQRLAERRALVRRLGAVEALGRVDIACVDKTGTLTEGRLAVELVAAADGTGAAPDRLAPELRDVLLSAAFACPRPESFAAGAHVTDAAVLAAADTAGLAEALTAKRGAEAPFDPARPFHAVVAAGRLRVKGSPEALLPRCDRMRLAGREVRLTSARRRALADRAERLAAEGLRVLLVAEGTAQVHPADPRPLVAVGLLGISDALRPGVAAAVRRCQAAGVRLVMLTGDHPATARTVARKIGLAAAGVDILTGADIERLEEDELARRLEQGAVVARISPLEKLRVVQSLQGRGHVVAMTGDGVNDAPALRLADVGVAMGLAGTQVACEAADVVLADDDFSTLVEALIEGRSFWQSTRRALAMLLGGNLGEVGFIAAWALLGLPGGLTTRQVLAVNLGSDVLPAFSLAVQAPAQRDLSALAREGTASLGAPLVRDIRTRALATAVPSLAASAAALRAGVEQAQAVGYGSIIATQVAQSFDTARRTGRSTGPAAAAAASFALVAASLTLPPLRRALALAAPTRLGWLLIGGSTAGAVLMARALGSDGRAASSSR
jgi:calcium-translocating P-type ATPase